MVTSINPCIIVYSTPKVKVTLNIVMHAWTMILWEAVTNI